MNELRPIQSEFTSGGPAAGDAASGNPDRFVNREFSWLQFNRRVLEEAGNARHPLLERVRFLSISAANLDEFFMVRVAGLAGQVREGIVLRSPDGRTPEQQLEHLLREVERLQEDQQKSLSGLMRLLREEGIDSVTADQLARDEIGWLEEHFHGQVFPVLTPLSIDPAHPFPFIPNLGFSIALQLRNRKDGQEMSALLRLPDRAQALHPPARPQVACALHTGRGDRRPVHRQAVSRLRGEGLRHLPHHPRQRHRGGGGIRGPGALLRDRAEAPPPRLGHPHRVRRPDAGGAARLRGRRARRRGGKGKRARRAAGHQPDFGNRRGAARRPEIHALQSALSGAHPRASGRLLRGDPREGHRRPPPLRILRRRGPVPAPGRRRSGSGGDKADALPHLERQSDRARADRCGRGRKIGDGARRAEGALRRGGQHPLVARPGAGRRAGGVRLHRAEDACQDVAGGAPRGRQAAQLRASRDRQLPSDHRPHLYRPVLLHHGPADRPRRGADLQFHHRLRRAGRDDADRAFALYAERAASSATSTTRSATPARAGRPASG